MARLAIAIFTSSMIALEAAGKADEVKPLYYRRNATPTKQFGRADYMQERSVENAVAVIGSQFQEGEHLVCRTTDGKTDGWIGEYKVTGSLAKEDLEEEAQKVTTRKGKKAATGKPTLKEQAIAKKTAFVERMETRSKAYAQKAANCAERAEKARAKILELTAATAAPAAPAAAPVGETAPQANQENAGAAVQEQTPALVA